MIAIVPIAGRIQPYAWGGQEFIPTLLGHPPGAQPAAEYWLGDHPGAPAEVLADTGPQPLTDFLAAPLPFLLKVLDVRAMLSIQVHPTRAQAEAGFEREEAAGVPLGASHRNYKDRSDKPELMVALSPFYLLHGFAEPALIARRLARYPALAPLAATLTRDGLKAAFAHALRADDPEVAAMQATLAAQLPAGEFAKTEVEFWYQRWLASDSAQARGLLTLFFFNLVELPPGAAIFQPAGLLHAYLEGQNIELMASSDNVLRAGLTPKHIDVEQLLAVGIFSATDPADYLIQPTAGAPFETVYPTPFEQFTLSCLTGPAGGELTATGAEIWLVTAGSCELRSGAARIELPRGRAALVQPGAALEVTLAPASSVFRAQGMPAK